MVTNPATTNRFSRSQRTIYPTINIRDEYFVLWLAVRKNGMMIQMVDRPNTTPIAGQDRETLTFKALLYLNVAVHAQVCRLFCLAHIPLFTLVQLGYPAITNIFSVPWHLVIAGFHCVGSETLWAHFARKKKIPHENNTPAFH